jgi:hypothetical protein
MCEKGIARSVHTPRSTERLQITARYSLICVPNFRLRGFSTTLVTKIFADG